jgi:ferredoxin
VRLRVIDGRCAGHARCASLVPEVFDLDDDGYAYVLPGREHVDDDDARAQGQLAIDNCPEQAIVLEDD